MAIAAVAAGSAWATGDDPSNVINYDLCGRNHNQYVEEQKKDDADQEWVDFYLGLRTEHENHEQDYVQRANNLQDTDTLIWVRAQAAAVSAHKNNTNISLDAMIQAGYEPIEAHYAAQQYMMLEDAETQMANMNYQITRAEGEDYLNGSDIVNVGTVNANGSLIDTNAVNASFTGKSVNVTYKLADGSTHTISVLTYTNTETGQRVIASPVPTRYVVGTSADYNGTFAMQYHDSWVPASGNQAGYWTQNENATVIVATASDDMTNYTDAIAYNPSMYTANFRTTSDKVAQLKANLPGWAESMRNALNNGTISHVEATPTTAKIDSYANETASSQYYIYKVATLAGVGFQTPDLNNVSRMKIDVNGGNTSYTGYLLARQSPDNGWQVGQQYVAGNWSRVMIVGESGAEVELDDSDTFTITSATDMDGNELSSVSTKQYVEKTYNNTAYLEMVEAMEKLTQEIEDREPSGVGGAGGPAVGPMQALAMLIALLAGLYVMYGRDEEPPRGGR
ncbi:hypothetical protein [Halobacterium zhouii]|uniref:hypothetical protein n=1 Tax=Halobacterium zhouii TaxID=2902624 RepID=UPI001E4BE70C|nr:hypothetical protein [Halobacterium zhouii]